MRFLNEERLSLPREILKTILSERRMEEAGESEALDAEIQVYCTSLIQCGLYALFL